MDRFVDISVHKSQNGQKYFLKWLTVVASSEQLRRSMVVAGPKTHLCVDCVEQPKIMYFQYRDEVLVGTLLQAFMDRT